MVDLNQKDADGVELPSRALHVIGPDKTIKLSLFYPAATREKHGRSGAGGGVAADDCKLQGGHPGELEAWRAGGHLTMRFQ